MTTADRINLILMLEVPGVFWRAADGKLECLYGIVPADGKFLLMKGGDCCYGLFPSLAAARRALRQAMRVRTAQIWRTGETYEW